MRNNSKHTHSATLASSTGRVCLALALALAFTLSAMGGVAQAAPPPPPPHATPPPPPPPPLAKLLGSTSSFAVLSAAPDALGAVTLTSSTVTGNVGSSGPRTSVAQTGSTIVGKVIAPVSRKVLTDFDSAYDALAAMPIGVVLTGTLAGVTLAPGVYSFDAAAELTGVLTLNGPKNGIWIFKIGTTVDPLTNLPTGALTGTNFSVVMAGDGQACNVYWLVADAATLTDSFFVGTILAGADITITRGTFTGNALATAGVTMTDTVLVGCNGKGK